MHGSGTELPKVTLWVFVKDLEALNGDLIGGVTDKTPLQSQLNLQYIPRCCSLQTIWPHNGRIPVLGPENKVHTNIHSANNLMCKKD